jgi:AcrR family transcriptional regulator
MSVVARTRMSPADRREELIRLGRELFAEEPYDALSVEDIAAAAGISKGLLYHYFETKRDFYVAVVRSAADEIRELTVPDPSLPLRQQLKMSIVSYLDYAEDHIEGVRAVFEGGVGSDPEFRRITEQLRSVYIRRILRGLGVQRPSAALRIALRGWMGYIEAASLEWLERGGIGRDEFVESVVRTLEAAVRTAS